MFQLSIFWVFWDTPKLQIQEKFRDSPIATTMVSLSFLGCIKIHIFFNLQRTHTMLFSLRAQCPLLLWLTVKKRRKIQTKWSISYHSYLEGLGFWSGWHGVHARCFPKNGAAAADVLLNTFPAINHQLVSPAIYQQLLPRLGPGDGQYIRRQAQSLFTPLHRGKYIHFTGVNISGVDGV